MHIVHMLACGLLLILISVRMEAKPVIQTQQKSLRSLLGEELSEYLTSVEQEGQVETTKSRSRLLRDLRVKSRSKMAWSRILNDSPNSRKYKGGKQVLTKGCFGLKLDRIGSMSGLGC
nr:PREDICTED: C-type natriuretic peptide [Latimeria chalumnae]|eukprot:XP_005997422.1 PREDICTED: C-type natriuretic peptide [Latimeria chalumnae]